MDKYNENPWNYRKKSRFRFSGLTLSQTDVYNCKTRVFPDGQQISVCHKNNVFGGDPYKNLRHSVSFDSELRGASFNSYYQECQLDDCVTFDGLKMPNSIQQLIDNNIGLYECGFISKARCVELNTALRAEGRRLMSLDPFKTSAPRPISERSDIMKRAKDKVYDYILCNSWDWFFTGTINPKKMDSSKPKECLKPLKTWLNHMQQRYGISYICIFEHHKNGNIHMHGLLKEDACKPLRLVDSGTKKYYGFKRPMKNRTAKKYGLDPQKGIPVYNLQSWRFGFTTAIRTYGEPAQLAHYVTKYLTKDAKKIFGKYYWHSRDLQKPKIIYSNVDFDSISAAENHGFKYFTP